MLFSQKQKKKNKGFVLLLTLLLVALMLLIIISITSSTTGILGFSGQSVRSQKAYYAADTGLGCASYLSGRYHVFDTTSKSGEYTCGLGGNFIAGGSVDTEVAGVPGTTNCEERSYNIPLHEFANGACATLEITVSPVTDVPDMCNVVIYSHGKSSCSGGGNVVERTRWLSM